MELQTLKPEYLTARVVAAERRNELRTARGALEYAEHENERHADEIGKATQNAANVKLITNARAAIESGAGAHVIYATRCKSDGHPCAHDPRERPYSDVELANSRDEIAGAEKRLTTAEKKLAALEADASFDAFANAADVGSRFVWWGAERYTDPRRTARWRGAPVTAEHLADLGPHQLQHEVAAGRIVEVQI